jgi:hypothetical protein
MASTSGIKLSLQGSGRHDRRVRFATVHVRAEGAGAEVELVTDSRGRLRYRLAPGAYRLLGPAGVEVCFEVSRGWTPVRARLS